MIRIFMIGYSNQKGGVETYIQNLCRNLDSDIYEIVYSWPIMKIKGKEWVCPPNRHNYPNYVRFWKKFYRENHFDVLYYNVCDIVSIDQLKFAKAANVPVRIIHAHNTGNQQAIGKRMRLVHRIFEWKNRKTLHQYATHLFACSKTAGDWMFDGRKYKVIQNGIDIEKYHYRIENRHKCRNQIGVGDEKLVGCIGRLDPQKNPGFTIEIGEKMRSLDENAKLVMIGDGVLSSDVRAKITKLGLEDRVLLTGAVDNVHEWMSAIDCLVMPSLFEGLPFVLVEAQAAGLTCIVSSNVSHEANITNQVVYMNLEDGAEKWAQKALTVCDSERPNVDQMLIDAGYSIQATAGIVEQEIHAVL